MKLTLPPNSMVFFETSEGFERSLLKESQKFVIEEITEDKIYVHSFLNKEEKAWILNNKNYHD